MCVRERERVGGGKKRKRCLDIRLSYPNLSLSHSDKKVFSADGSTKERTVKISRPRENETEQIKKFTTARVMTFRLDHLLDILQNVCNPLPRDNWTLSKDSHYRQLADVIAPSTSKDGTNVCQLKLSVSLQIFNEKLQSCNNHLHQENHFYNFFCQLTDATAPPHKMVLTFANFNNPCHFKCSMRSSKVVIII